MPKKMPHRFDLLEFHEMDCNGDVTRKISESFAKVDREADAVELWRVGPAGESATLVVSIPLSGLESKCRVGCKSYVFNYPDASCALLFLASASDAKLLEETLRIDKKSMFYNRTEESSANQYFQFYGYLSQQQNMLQDYIRTSTYERAVMANLPDFEGKVVLDVGAGSGILSFFCVQAGAKKVYAVEASTMAEHAEALVKANKYEDRITVIAGKIEEIDLPENVDIIISEPMGYMLYNERMLETYLHAKKWLKSGGKMFPTQGDLHAVPFTDEALYMEQINKASFWLQKNFHTVDLTPLLEEATHEYFRQPVVDTFDIRICCAKSVKHTVDFSQAHETDLHKIVVPLEFTATQTATVHGLAFWFDVAFVGSCQTVWLSTAPTEALTHWYQVRCLLYKPIFAKLGQKLTGVVVMEANSKQSYDVHIELALEGFEEATKSSNVLDLKNPYFRYTGQPVQPPPGYNTISPTDMYWSQAEAARHAPVSETYDGSSWPPNGGNVAVTVNGYANNHHRHAADEASVSNDVMVVSAEMEPPEQQQQQRFNNLSRRLMVEGNFDPTEDEVMEEYLPDF